MPAPPARRSAIDAEGNWILLSANSAIITVPRGVKEKVFDRIGILADSPAPAYLGSGSYGVAVKIDNERVLKITEDKMEAQAAKNLQGKSLKTVYRVYDVFAADHGGVENIFYYILQEFLVAPDTKWQGFARRWHGLAGGSITKQKIETFIQELSPETLHFKDQIEWLRTLVRELGRHGIVFGDLHGSNIMKRPANDEHVVIDIGSNSQSPPVDIPTVARLFEAIADSLQAPNTVSIAGTEYNVQPEVFNYVTSSIVNQIEAGTGTLKKLKKLFPQDTKAIDELAAKDPSGEKYAFLEWMWKQVRNGEDEGNVTWAIQRFFDLMKATDNKVKFQGQNVSDLERILDQHEEKLQYYYEKLDHEETKKRDPELLYDKDGFRVTMLFNKEQLQKVGKGTNWCVTRPGTKYFEHYDKPNQKYLYIELPDGHRRLAQISQRDEQPNSETEILQLRDENQTGEGDVKDTDLSRWVLDELDYPGNYDAAGAEYEKEKELVDGDGIFYKFLDWHYPKFYEFVKAGNYPGIHAWLERIKAGTNPKGRFYRIPHDLDKSIVDTIRVKANAPLFKQEYERIMGPGSHMEHNTVTEHTRDRYLSLLKKLKDERSVSDSLYLLSEAVKYRHLSYEFIASWLDLIMAQLAKLIPVPTTAAEAELLEAVADRLQITNFILWYEGATQALQSQPSKRSNYRLWPNGVRTELHSDSNFVTIDSIISGDEGEGKGTEVMHELIHAADSYSVPLRLMAVPPIRLGNYKERKERLESWYKRLGFKPVDNDVMVREPSSVATAAEGDQTPTRLSDLPEAITRVNYPEIARDYGIRRVVVPLNHDDLEALYEEWGHNKKYFNMPGDEASVELLFAWRSRDVSKRNGAYTLYGDDRTLTIIAVVCKKVYFRYAFKQFKRAHDIIEKELASPLKLPRTDKKSPNKMREIEIAKQKVELEGFNEKNEFHIKQLHQCQTIIEQAVARLKLVFGSRLNHIPHIQLNFKGKPTAAASYITGKNLIVIWTNRSMDDIKKEVSYFIHEFGHFVMSNYLSQKAKVAWRSLVSTTNTTINIPEFVQRVWRPDEMAGDAVDRLKEESPEDAIHLAYLLLYWHRGKVSRDQLLKTNKTVNLSKHPVSPYGETDPEEAFCDALGLLVAYGPRTVHPMVISWIKMFVPELKVEGNTTTDVVLSYSYPKIVITKETQAAIQKHLGSALLKRVTKPAKVDGLVTFSISNNRLFHMTSRRAIAAVYAALNGVKTEALVPVLDVFKFQGRVPQDKHGDYGDAVDVFGIVTPNYSTTTRKDMSVQHMDLMKTATKELRAAKIGEPNQVIRYAVIGTIDGRLVLTNLYDGRRYSSTLDVPSITEPDAWWSNGNRLSLEDAEARFGFDYYHLIKPGRKGVGDRTLVREPYVPFRTMKNEDEGAKRIAVAPTIYGCMAGLHGGITPEKLKGGGVKYTKRWASDFEGWYVYGTNQKEGLVSNDEVRQYVPDADKTGEAWYVEPVKFSLVGTLHAGMGSGNEYTLWIDTNPENEDVKLPLEQFASLKNLTSLITITTAATADLVGYHGSSVHVEHFDESKLRRSEYGRGFYFTDNPDIAEKFGPVVSEYRIQLENPLHADQLKLTQTLEAASGTKAPGTMTEKAAWITDTAKQLGYDGIIVRLVNGSSYIIAFNADAVEPLGDLPPQPDITGPDKQVKVKLNKPEKAF